MRPYRYDIVGSFLRPDYLKDARAEYAEGTLSADQLNILMRQSRLSSLD